MAEGDAVSEFRLELMRIESSDQIKVCLREFPGGERDIPCQVLSPLARSYTTVQELGRALYECLFPGEIRHHFEDCRSTYAGEGEATGVRLRLIVDIMSVPDQHEPLLDLPWELLHDGRGWLALDPALSIVRRLNVRSRRSDSPATPSRLRVLAAFAEPAGKPKFEGEQAFSKIVQAIGFFRPLRLKALPHATKRKLEPLVRQGAHVVHFLGHGDVETQKAQIGQLFLEHEESPTSDILTATELAGWVENAGLRPRLFVLTACYGGSPSTFGFMGVATALLDVGVEAVVAMQSAVWSDVAEIFSKAFYEALANRFTVDDAVQRGRQAVYSDPEIGLDSSNVVLQIVPDPKRPGVAVVRFDLVSSKKEGALGQAPGGMLLPNWAVPVLFLHGDGWLGLGPPRPELVSKKDGKEMVYIVENRLYVDKYPVTREEYRRFAGETGRVVPWQQDATLLERLQPHLPRDTVQLGGPPPAEEDPSSYWEKELPATNVRLEDAQAYARWAGKRLLTPEEWRQAALSRCPDQPFPWGSEALSDRGNTRERGWGVPWPVTFSKVHKGDNPAGMCDIVGNVAELTRDAEGSGVLCGGSFKEPLAECAIQRRTRLTNPHFTNDGVGFRCAAPWEDVELSESDWQDEEDHP